MSRRTILDCTRLAVAGTPAAIGVFDQKQWERLCNQYMSDSAKKSCLQRAKAQEDEYAREQEGRADRIYNAVKDVGREQGRLDVKDRQRSAMDDLWGILADLKRDEEVDRCGLAKKLRAAFLALDHAYWASPTNDPPQRAEETEQERTDRIYNAVKDVGREQGRLDVKDRQRIAMADLQGIVANLKGIAEIDRNELAKKLHAAILALDHAYWASP